jgi:hypothetical protein
LLEAPKTENALPGARADRRRPGRIEHISPALIPLVRGIAAPPEPLIEQAEPDLAAATGILVAVLISLPIWTLVIWLI